MEPGTRGCRRDMFAGKCRRALRALYPWYERALVQHHRAGLRVQFTALEQRFARVSVPTIEYTFYQHSIFCSYNTRKLLVLFNVGPTETEDCAGELSPAATRATLLLSHPLGRRTGDAPRRRKFVVVECV